MGTINAAQAALFGVSIIASFIIGVRVGIEGALRVIRNNILGQARNEQKR